MTSQAEKKAILLQWLTDLLGHEISKVEVAVHVARGGREASTLIELTFVVANGVAGAVRCASDGESLELAMERASPIDMDQYGRIEMRDSSVLGPKCKEILGETVIGADYLTNADNLVGIVMHLSSRMDLTLLNVGDDLVVLEKDDHPMLQEEPIVRTKVTR